MEDDEVKQFQQAIKDTIGILRINGNRIQDNPNWCEAGKAWIETADRLEYSYNKYFGIDQSKVN